MEGQKGPLAIRQKNGIKVSEIHCLAFFLFCHLACIFMFCHFVKCIFLWLKFLFCSFFFFGKERLHPGGLSFTDMNPFQKNCSELCQMS